MSAVGRPILALEIEGVGTASGQYLFAKRSRTALQDAAAADPNSLVQGDVWDGWPAPIMASIDFLPGSKPRIGAQKIQLRRTDLTRGIFFRDPAVAAKATASIDESATSVTLDTSGLTGVLWWEREALLLGAESPSGTYAVTRGHLGTHAAPHNAGDDRDDDELFAHCPNLQLRAAKIWKIDVTSTDVTSDRELFWAGFLRGVDANTPGIYTLDLVDALFLVRKTELMRGVWRGTVQSSGPVDAPVWGEIGLEWDRPNPSEDLLFAGGGGVQDALLSFDGKHALLAESITAARPSLFQDNTSRWARSPELREPPDIGLRVWEFLSTAPGNPLGLSSEPAELLLQILTTTPEGTGGADDLGYGPVGCGVPRGAINTDSIEAWGRRVSGTALDALHLGFEGKPENAYRLIQDKIVGPFGAYLTQGKDGRLTVVMLSDGAVYGSDTAIAESAFKGEPGLVTNRHKTHDKVSLFYDDIPGIGPAQIDADSAKKYRRNPRGEHDSVTFHADAITDAAIAQILAAAHVERWHKPLARVTFKTLRTEDHEVGTVVELTHPKVHALDSEATFGVVDEPVLIVSRSERITDTDDLVSYEALMVAAIHGAGGVFIAPSAEVVSFDAGTNELTLDANIFSLDANDPINPDHEPFEGGWVIQICDDLGTPLTGATAVTVDSKAGAVLTLNGAYAPAAPDRPANGDLVRIAKYPSAAAVQQDEWAYTADADSELGGAASTKTYRLV